MLHLNRESAPYSELDFPRFNPRGFNRVRQAVEVAQQARALGQTSAELRDATNALRRANDIRNAEQQVAQQAFAAEREKAFVVLESAIRRFHNAFHPAPQRLELENRLDHLITLFNLKDFSAVQRELTGVLNLMRGAPARAKPDRYPPARPLRPNRSEQGVSALFQRGLALERAGRRREAIEVYGQVIQRSPRHWQVLDRLREIGKVAEFGRTSRQRRPSCTRKYKRYVS